MGLLGRYIGSLPDTARDRIIRAQEWSTVVGSPASCPPVDFAEGRSDSSDRSAARARCWLSSSVRVTRRSGLRMLRSAAQHGEQWLRQGFSELLLFQEHHLLWQSAWTYVQHRFSGTGIARNAVTRIDTALALASGASLRGYHRPMYEDLRRWPEIIDKLAPEWRPPAPPDLGGPR